MADDNSTNSTNSTISTNSTTSTISTMSHNEMEPLMTEILLFSKTNEESMLLNHELTKKERMIIHNFIESLGLYSESIPLKGSNNKKILVQRQGEPKDKSNYTRPIDSEDVDTFASNIGAPYPCTDPDMVEYYNEVFDPMFDSKAKWNLFLSERRNNGIAIRKEISIIREKIFQVIRENPNYTAYQRIRLRGTDNRIRGDVYHHGSDGKIFVSLDIMSANFTCIRMLCPELFTNDNGDLISWHDFIRKFTKSEFIAQSKMFREILFGKLGFQKGSNVLQESIMERVDQVLREDKDLKSIFNKTTIRMKCGDENVYELVDQTIQVDNHNVRPYNILLKAIGEGAIQNLMRKIKISEIPLLTQVFDELGLNTDIELGNIFHIRIFKVDKIGSKKYFLKTFVYRSEWNCDIMASDEGCMKIMMRDQNIPLRQSIEFKKVDKRFYLQVLKHIQKLPIEDNDMYFTDSGTKAKYCYSIFD